MSSTTLKSILDALIPDNSQLRASAHRQANETMVDAFYWPIGIINAFPGSSIPDNWALCNGQEISRSLYLDLFNCIGTTYGIGDGSTTFNLPSIPVGGTPVQCGTSLTLGTSGGEINHLLTIAEIPSHSHTTDLTAEEGGPSQVDMESAGSGKTYTSGTGLTGGGQVHNNMQPYVAMNWIIRIK